MTWKYWTPERDGHAPDDWVEGMEWDYPEYIDNPKSKAALGAKPYWWAGLQYCYRPAQTECHTPLQDATYEPDLLAQCLALPQDQREALIEAMQKPQRDWADDVWEAACASANEARAISQDKAAAAVIRSMCRPKEVEIDDEIVRKFAHELANQPYFGIASILTRFIREALS